MSIYYLNKIFINTNNTVYFSDQSNNRTQIWLDENITLTKTISNNLVQPSGLFVTTLGDIYVENSISNYQVEKWTSNATSGVPVMYTCAQCVDVFVDISNTLYCSMNINHQVLKKPLNDGSNALKIVAGTGIGGNTPFMLWYPGGIFVDINFDLYVADCNNDRIQLFKTDQLNATTIAGNGATSTITLQCPSAVVLDGNKYLFIVDHDNHRIVGSGPNGFQCLVGCSGSTGAGSSHLSYPTALAFDSFGNIFVSDADNNRIQKFILAVNSCSKYNINNSKIALNLYSDYEEFCKFNIFL
jgi:hypothetical protein